jgi:hypothetical protein
MAEKRKSCGTNHRFHEHSIGAGLTRKICTGCGLLQIGQGRRAVLAENPWEGPAPALFVQAS